MPARATQLILAGTLVVLASGCERPSDPAAELHCYLVLGGAPGGINPLALGTYLCHDDARVCQERAKPDPGAQCIASGPPRWHCFSMNSRGPLGDAMFCYPGAPLCEVSRQALASNTDIGVDAACTADDTVFCSGDTSVICFSEQADCYDGISLNMRALGQPRPVNDCQPRRSAR